MAIGKGKTEVTKKPVSTPALPFLHTELSRKKVGKNPQRQDGKNDHSCHYFVGQAGALQTLECTLFEKEHGNDQSQVVCDGYSRSQHRNYHQKGGAMQRLAEHHKFTHEPCC